MYEKTIVKSSGITSGNDVAIPHNISNIDNICAYTGYALLPNGSGYVNYADNGYYVEMHEASRTNTMWKIGSSIAPQIGSLIIVLRYTKTTDTAGSGTWTPQGVPAVHYSTDEKVVGTWIDGSTIYEAVWDFGSNLQIEYNGWTTTSIPKSGYGMFLSTTCLSATGSFVGEVYINIGDTDYVQLQTPKNGNYIFARYIIVRYTKSSS